MTTWLKCCAIEKEAEPILLEFMSQHIYDNQYVLTNKGRLSKELQKRYGDLLYNNYRGEVRAVEFKAEAEEKHGNLFLEVWSNRKWETPGWMHTLDADLLVYCFLKPLQIHVLSFPRLKAWAFGDEPNRIASFRLWEQKKRDQLNDSWGRCVPIEVLRDEAKMATYVCGASGKFEKSSALSPNE